LSVVFTWVTLQHSAAAMARAHKLLEQILRGDADANIPFSGMLQLLKRLGFQERVKGSHHILSREGVIGGLVRYSPG